MSLYDRDNPQHQAYEGQARARQREYTLSRRGTPGFCPTCGASVDGAGECVSINIARAKR